jgi:iron complex outermembrane recepter protein
LQGDAVYTSRVNDDATGDPAVRVAGATIVGGRAGVRSSDGRWSLAVFGRNLFGTFRPTVRFAAPTAAQELDPKAYAQMMGPESRRVIGLSFDARL